MQKEVLAELAKGQQPYATIIGCSDSRVPPELVFDAGFGELFIVRVAGNVVSPEVMGTLQYAAVHLHTPLFVVLGHEGCGAVQAALAGKDHGARERERIELLLSNILPGLEGLDGDWPRRDASTRPSRRMCAGRCGSSARRRKDRPGWRKASSSWSAPSTSCRPAACGSCLTDRRQKAFSPSPLKIASVRSTSSAVGGSVCSSV